MRTGPKVVVRTGGGVMGGRKRSGEGSGGSRDEDGECEAVQGGRQSQKLRQRITAKTNTTGDGV